MIRSYRIASLIFNWLAAFLLVLGTCGTLGAQSNSSKPTARKRPTKAAKSPALRETAPVKTYGSNTAPITMEVFSDFECPACGRFYEDTLRLLINDYVASGKVYLIHRDFPLPIHKYSRVAARYANAAARLGKFPQVEAALYDNQAAWTASGDIEKYLAGALTPAEMNRVRQLMQGCDLQGAVVTATTATSSPAANHSCIVDPPIQHDVALGEKVPVQQTPTAVFTYKGQRISPISGIVSYSLLKPFFDELLRQ